MNDTKKLKDSMKALSLFFRSMDTPYDPGKDEMGTLLHLLSGVVDFRVRGKVRYKIENILGICFYLAMKGEFTSFLYSSTYVRVHKDEFIRLGLVEEGSLPSHDTFLYVFNHLDAYSLRDAFIGRFKAFLDAVYEISAPDGGQYKLLSGDGKTFNGSGRVGGKRNSNVFNVYSPTYKLCSVSIPLDDKDSEIPAMQCALSKLDLRRTVVTADALHCQRRTCEIVRKRRGHYVFKAKANQASLLEDIRACFEKHGRKAASLSHNHCDYEVLPLRGTSSYSDWPGCKSYVKMVSHKRDGQRDASHEPQFFVSSIDDPQLIAEAIDNRWDIEDGLHLFKDQFLGEDECTFTDKNAVKVMATINNIVYAYYRIAAAVTGRPMIETTIRYKEDPVALISLVTPLLKKTNLNALIRRNMRGVRKA